ncbi:hypothetical protein [Nostoc sp.]|uniref:hypothetical protein n=1 Tax=Nostoc sp. TaxID=1180 RepID=UPI002FF85938
MEKVFAKKLGFLPDKESEFLILDKVELRVNYHRSETIWQDWVEAALSGKVREN